MVDVLIVTCAMLLSYYAKYWPSYSDYVDGSVLSNPGNEEGFSDKLLYYITGSRTIPKDSKGNPIGVSPSIIPDGVKKYLVQYRHAKNIINLNYLNKGDYSENNLINALQNDEPIMLELYKHAPYIDSKSGQYGHEVTAWG